jgi:hypothetical protein
MRGGLTKLRSFRFLQSSRNRLQRYRLFARKQVKIAAELVTDDAQDLRRWTAHLNKSPHVRRQIVDAVQNQIEFNKPRQGGLV